MSNVNYIKQKAIEIANNSLSKILMGVMNQKNEQSINDNCVTFDELEGSCFDEFAIDLTPKVIRLSKARQERNEIRMARRRERLNK